MNEVHILMCVKNSPLLPFKALYQDRNVLFILYNFWSGESLYKIVHSGYKFSEAEKA
jgi:hypothetical protein